MYIYIDDNNVGLSIEGTGVQVHLMLFRNMDSFGLPLLPVCFERYPKTGWSLLSGVYASGSTIFHT